MGLFNKRKKELEKTKQQMLFYKECLEKLEASYSKDFTCKAAPANVLGLLYFEKNGKLYFSSRSAGSRVESLPDDILVESTEQFVEILKKNMLKSLLRERVSE